MRVVNGYKTLTTLYDEGNSGFELFWRYDNTHNPDIIINPDYRLADYNNTLIFSFIVTMVTLPLSSIHVHVFIVRLFL